MSEIELGTKFLRFRQIWPDKRKTKVFIVYSTHTGDQLGLIRWHSAWRRYVFELDGECIWSIECMAQCYKFMQQLMNERKGVKDER